ncbi:MAG: TonB-dependent receptor [Opitutaceae bacterium]|nr:TonB-dependent receptor [Opitutaceae bacterium]
MKPLRTLSITFLALILRLDAHAQASPLPAARDPGSDTPVELTPFEVRDSAGGGFGADSVISGTGLNTSLKALPMPVEVITSEFIQDIGATELSTILEYGAGLAQNQNENETLPYVATNYSIRGFSTNRVYYDGFRTDGRLSPLFMDRVEIIRGPSSTFTGPIEPGGTVNVIPKRAAKRRSASASIALGSWDRLVSEFSLAGPVGTTGVSYRLGATYANGRAPADFFQNESLSLGTSIEWRISDKTRVVLDAESRNASQTPTTSPIYTLAGTPGIVPVRRSFNRMGPESFSDIVQIRGILRVIHRINDNWLFRVGCFARWQEVDQLQVTGANTVAINATTGARTVPFTPETLTANSFWYSPQASLLGTFEYGKITHKVLLSHDQNLTPWQYNRRTQRTTAFSRLDLDNPSYPSFSDFRSWGRLTNDTEIVYIQRRTSLSNIATALGGRLTLVQGFTRGDSYGKTVTNTAVTTTAERRLQATADASGADVWSGGISYEMNRTYSAYFSYSESYVPQNNLFDFEGKVFAPLMGSGYNYGIKYSLLQDRLMGAVQGYTVKRENVLQPDPDHPGSSIPSGNDASQGFEFRIVGRVNKAWQVSANYGYVDAKVTSDPTRPQNVGLVPVNTPRDQASLWNRYAITSGPLKNFSAGFGIVYMGDRRGTATLPLLEAYTRIDASVQYRARLAGYNTSFVLGLNNLNDSNNLVSQTSLADPRSIRLTIRTNF